jgi:phenylalanyl-tRNA synthetase alpha chain
MQNSDKKDIHIHPITRVIDDMNRIFFEMGFTLVDGPELEDEYHNFDALNVPKDHPARDMQDTFWVKPSKEFGDKGDKLMTTQTSAMQIHFMENNKPPIKIVCPGRVFRNEATDARHEAIFHQCEGLLVDKNVSLSDLKSTINTFFDKFLKRDVNVRFRPSTFHSLNTGVEVDVTCFKCKGKVSVSFVVVPGGLNLVERNGTSKVLKSVNINSDEWRGFAFGFGVDRLAMLKFEIDDIRLLYSGDLRLVNQF